MKIDSWAGEIAEIGAIYPFGSETIMALIGLVLWLVWFVLQGRMENREYREEIADMSGKDEDSCGLSDEG